MLDIGSVGIWWSTAYDRSPFGAEAEALAEIDDQGWGAVWLPEATGREVMAHSALALSATRRIPVIPGIANLWARDAVAMANGARTLAEAHPNRFALGVGVSHRLVVESRGSSGDYSPLETVTRYLDRMDQAPYTAARPAEEPARLLAALGPQMLRLAAARTAGAHTYTVPVEHTALAREALGDGPVLAVEQKVVLSRDPDTARTTARKFLPLALPNYRSNLLRCGFDADDLEDGGTDEVVDRLVAWGEVDVVRARVEQHLSAGASHVCLQVLPLDRQLPRHEWRRLADALITAPV
ncbi:MAG: TIGR03620 family F420-dependent LLM class oxidoreductase [Microbacterium sp.]|uniref:TIGR03620 family F420-dependent LLM class oxidoreductase n=1 Tax=Microbacterium sp. TaxID=51671 RepID=UPI001DB9C921|nr:TIGR03620 family F420-dependent LLM class oxidoreductase [Microbacterium sp.]MBW8764596.1 TIGR03620 family F420-dependent LLM class oxidoreductase [Microbacterium sp.]